MKLTKAEVNQLEQAKSFSTIPAVREIAGLKVGESAFIEQDDWTATTHPTSYFTQYFRNGFKVSSRRRHDLPGWVITRKQ